MLACALLWGCATAPFGTKTPSPAMTVGSPVYDFEYAGPTQAITHEFKFTNSGNASVSVTGVSVCCGCQAQTAGLLNTPIAPGQEDGILITCTMPRYEGPVKKVVSLHTDAEGGESIPLTIKGMIKRDLVVTPTALSFGTIKKGATVQKRLRVLELSGQQLDIPKVMADPDLYTIETERFDELNHRGVDLTVAFSANVALGTLTDVITLFTNNQRRSKIDVPVVARIVE
ncbi:DUF1573 domain-containing protein [Desulfosarcina ovata]|uniref:DUF1573 domain-containing protein n=1 Tax=Desulfosarcina ovata TaxID=83564 RepID=UPI001390F1B1|nr:DUF1573 domain-containing protein [Desulfosarcina ovata]